MPIQSPEGGPTVLLERNMNECVPDLSTHPKSIGWNLHAGPADDQSSSSLQQLNGSTGAAQCSFLAEVHVSHKQITDRFVELLNLFEGYSKIMKENERAQPKLKRSQSEQFTSTHLQESECTDQIKGSVSLTRVQRSDSTLLGQVPRLTCEMASQTYWSEVPDTQALVKTKKKNLEHLQYLQRQQPTPVGQAHTLLIEVESISSSTALQRAPIRQRLWQVLNDAGQSLLAGLTMMGENFTYVMFVVLCLWCLYLVIGHYYSFLESNINRQSMPRARPKQSAVAQVD